MIVRADSTVSPHFTFALGHGCRQLAKEHIKEKRSHEIRTTDFWNLITNNAARGIHLKAYQSLRSKLSVTYMVPAS